MTAPAGTQELKVVRVSSDGDDQVLGTIRLVDGKLEYSNPEHAAYLRRWTISGVPDGQIFAELADGGWSNGYIAIKP